MHTTSPPTTDDEISLLELYQTVRRRWKLIAALVVCGGAIGAALSFVIPPRYEASVYLQPPTASQYMEVNEGRTSLSSLKWVTGDDLYNRFLARLTSDAAKQEFFEKTYLPSLAEPPENEAQRQALYDKMEKKQVLVREPKPKGRPLYNVQIQAPSSELVVHWMEAFLGQVEASARQRWMDEEHKVLITTMKNIENDLSEKYALAEKLRSDREIRLTEALKVARTVGQVTPQLTMGQLPRQDSVTAFADGSSLYARGAKSLGAEIDVLRAREDETSFIDGLREAQARLSALKAQQLEGKEIGMYRIDGQLLKPARPVFPKKLLMVAIGLLIGLFAGVVLAFTKNAMASAGETH
ncbi:MAG: hypothetical protein LC137_13450 [Burkholderiales bacterium]|nr:hypothetical protein [Burkholderiales bacterium]